MPTFSSQPPSHETLIVVDIALARYGDENTNLYEWIKKTDNCLLSSQRNGFEKLNKNERVIRLLEITS